MHVVVVHHLSNSIYFQSGFLKSF